MSPGPPPYVRTYARIVTPISRTSIPSYHCQSRVCRVRAARWATPGSSGPTRHACSNSPGSPQGAACSRRSRRFDIVGGKQLVCQGVSSGRSRSAWPRPRAFASSGESTRAISDALSQLSQHIAISAPPSECSWTSSFGVGSEEPQSGQLSPFCCASRTAWRLCSPESAILAEQLLYIQMRRSPAACLEGGFHEGLALLRRPPGS
jgi:hypothetical protein